MNIRIPDRLRYSLAMTLVLGAALPTTSVWAAPTPAGSPIVNKATATFTDGTTTYDTTSNEVVISVAEIAGLALEAQPPVKLSNPSLPIVAGDTLYVDFVITNLGNDPTQFFIPGQATLSDGVNFSQNGPIQIVGVNGTALTTAVAVPNAGGLTGALLTPAQGSMRAADSTLVSPLPAGTLTIRVPIRVATTAASGSTTVTIGRTATAATPDAGNDTRSLDRTSIDTADLYTSDNPASDPTGTREANGTLPTNGVREAMATSQPIAIGSRLQAFATVLKAQSYSTGADPNLLADDRLTYTLALRVAPPSPLPIGVTATDLHGTQLTVLGSPATARYVLIADALPAGLQLAPTNPLGVTAANWTAVYSTTQIAGSTALTATWTIGQPPTGTAVTRVGFIYDTVAQGPIANGTTLSGFSIVTTPSASFNGAPIANIAQTVGQSAPGTPLAGTPTQIVYDESGDQTSNNGLVMDDPTSQPLGGGGITEGLADPLLDGIDSGAGTDPIGTTSNIGTDGGSGSGSNGTYPRGGEATVYRIVLTPLNGPFAQPDAVGPTDINDDYSNRSIVPPVGIDPAATLTDAQTPPKTFDNTVQNTSGAFQVISLRPIPPLTATLLPIDTRVTIVDPAGPTATYRYDGTTFVFLSGTGGTAADIPVRLTIASGGQANYQTIVDLPGGVAQFGEFPVSIAAFIDGNGDGLPTGDPSNITIDRLYTNYLRLFKEARMLEADGVTPVTGGAGSFSTDQSALSAAATPGRIIEYRITYRNISSSGGSGNLLLPANSLEIIENGSAGSNSWGTTTLDPKYPTQPLGSAIDSLGSLGSITVTTGGTPLNITEYRSRVTTVPPQVEGFFTFQRQIRP